MGFPRGSYFISEEDRDQFYDLYCKVLKDKKQVYLTEKSRPIAPLRIDLDFKYTQQIDRHKHTQNQVINFAKAYMDLVKQYLLLPEETELYVMEKERPTEERKSNGVVTYKSGIHIVVPQVCTNKHIELGIRRTLLRRMEEFFANLGLKNDWDDVYDEKVLNRSQQWTLYGSQKGDDDSKPYLISYILVYKDNNIEVSNNIPEISVNFIKYLSLLEQKSETQLTEKGKTYGNIDGDPVNPGGNRGRNIQRRQQPSSRSQSPVARVVSQLDPEKREYLKDHVMNLNPERANDYDKWVKVALCLHNIHQDLLDVFLDFSSQNEEKYNEADCINKWNSLTFRNDGDRLQEGSLRAWSREDNYDGYQEIESRNIERLIQTARSCTEHDVSVVIYAMFRDRYKCADFRNIVWYRWAGHIWKETDSGVDLLMKLSKNVASKFLEKEADVAKEMSQRGLTECTGEREDRRDCGVCDYCKLDKERTDYHKVFTQLKKTSFKSNVMKECRELFFDEEFNKKIDANKDLIACENGVLDMSTENFEFRDGKPEDYISYSTGIDYDSTRKYYEYPAWPAVELFIQKVLPDREVREYFVRHLATNILGGNTAQKFHIMTGSGSNGKSMIMNLMSKALGEYACTVPISLFTQKRKGSGAAAPEVARLKGRRFVTMQEPDEAIALNTGLMKEITSGEKMYARDLFKSGMEFEVQAKFHLACNDKPKINTTDGGTWRRLVVINFISKFVPNPNGPNEYPLDESIQYSVNSNEWATTFLAYLIHLLKEGKGLRKLQAPAKVLEYTSEYRNENDGIAKFITEKVSEWQTGDPVLQVDKQTLRRIFKQWKDENDKKTLSVADLEKRIEAQYGAYPRGGWTNFKIEN
jgi:P4 family phage/plasmid primase-like protien